MWRTCEERDRQKPAFLIIWFLLFLLFLFFLLFHAFAERNSFLCFDLINISFPHFILFVLAFYVSKFELRERNPSFYELLARCFIQRLFALRTSITFICRNGKIFFTHLLIHLKHLKSVFAPMSVLWGQIMHSPCYLTACKRVIKVTVMHSFSHWRLMFNSELLWISWTYYATEQEGYLCKCAPFKIFPELSDMDGSIWCSSV